MTGWNSDHRGEPDLKQSPTTEPRRSGASDGAEERQEETAPPAARAQARRPRRVRREPHDEVKSERQHRGALTDTCIIHAKRERGSSRRAFELDRPGLSKQAHAVEVVSTGLPRRGGLARSSRVCGPRNDTRVPEVLLHEAPGRLRALRRCARGAALDRVRTPPSPGARTALRIAELDRDRLLLIEGQAMFFVACVRAADCGRARGVPPPGHLLRPVGTMTPEAHSQFRSAPTR